MPEEITTSEQHRLASRYNAFDSNFWGDLIEKPIKHRLIDSYRRGNAVLSLSEFEGHELIGYQDDIPIGYIIARNIGLGLEIDPWEVILGIIRIESSHTYYNLPDNSRRNGYKKAREIATKRWNTLTERKNVLNAVYDRLKNDEILDKFWGLYNTKFKPMDFIDDGLLYCQTVKLLPTAETCEKKINKQNMFHQKKITEIEHAIRTLRQYVPGIDEKEFKKITNVDLQHLGLLKKLPSSRVYTHSPPKGYDEKRNEQLRQILGSIVYSCLNTTTSTRERRYWKKEIVSPEFRIMMID